VDWDISPWLATTDRWVARIFFPLTIAILVSAVDDLIVDVAWFGVWVKNLLFPARRMFPPGDRQLALARRSRIAIFVPAWKEHAVIARMLHHNIASIRYPNFDFFIGAYPNDSLTQAAVRELARAYSNVHLALCPHDGPTSKADCLNWIYQHLALHEENNPGERFEIVVTHDAEDIIHPEALSWINYYAARFDMVQIPVLALATPVRSFTHGVYCDEFAEYQSRDMCLRAAFGAFVPSTGVGTGFRRDALDRLADAESNRIFDPGALTEDYDNGLCLKRLGCSQIFVPILRANGGDFVATREFFPKLWRAAVRQRTRWIMGIALQGWQRHGWRGGLGLKYWLWRDRKGLLTNPLSVLANLVFLYGIGTLFASFISGDPWGLAGAISLHPALMRITLVILAYRTFVRVASTGRIYGWRFAAAAPLRIFWANLINAEANVHAIARFAWARALGRALRWIKTDHAYPTRAALLSQRPALGEILVRSRYISAAELDAGIATLPPGRLLGQHLVDTGRISESLLYEALGLQHGLPFGDIDPLDVSANVARSLPSQLIRERSIMPVRISPGSLHVATTAVPDETLADAVAEFTELPVQFHLITEANFRRLCESLLGKAAGAGA
jgi:adsorption protein B